MFQTSRSYAEPSVSGPSTKADRLLGVRSLMANRVYDADGKIDPADFNRTLARISHWLQALLQRCGKLSSTAGACPSLLQNDAPARGPFFAAPLAIPYVSSVALCCCFRRYRLLRYGY